MTDTPVDVPAGPRPPQVSVIYQLPSAADARELRAAAFREGALPRDLIEHIAFSGHRGSCTVSALRPEGNAFLEMAPDLGLWLAARLGGFVPMQVSERAVGVRQGDRHNFTLGPVPLLKSGRGDWQRQGQDPAWIRQRILGRLMSDLSLYRAQWSDDPSPMPEPELVSVGRVMPIKVPLAGGGRELTWLTAVGVRLLWSVDLEGHWFIGAMASAGFGRLWYTPPAVPDGLMSVAEQMEALA